MLDRLAAHWPLKLLALALAFAIWVSVTGESRVVQDFRVPLEVQLRDKIALASSPPTTVDVRLRGVESVMRRLDPVRMVMRVDLREADEGEQDLVLARDSLSGVPRGVDVDFIDPNRVQVELVRVESFDLPVEPTLVGQPAAGYSLYDAIVNPKEISVEGPEEQVRGLEVTADQPDPARR